ncbi:hypothetical protein J6590_047985 [Homalodisca vitripennis]|nr:hypothetical protein J6590_047985 [Homalodisca vitripennis]
MTMGYANLTIRFLIKVTLKKVSRIVGEVSAPFREHLAKDRLTTALHSPLFG